jgi:hypothetical protein
MDKLKIDPRLLQALENTATRKGLVQAVVTVGAQEGTNPLAPAEAEKMVKEIVDRAARASNSLPHKLVIFPNMQSFSIEADPILLRKILDEDQVDAATLNTSP